jgi:starvation-inducible DNA-binding protein
MALHPAAPAPAPTAGPAPRTAGTDAPPAPAALATPTELGHDRARAVAAAVNPLVADALALYVKTKNFHWHLSGPRFRDLHLLLDEQADQLLAAVDPLAERVRKLGGTTLRSIGHVARLTGVADDDDAHVPAREMLLRLLEDNRRMAGAQRRAIRVCTEAGDDPTASLLQDVLDATERRIWFLFEASREDAADGRPEPGPRPGAG